MFTISLLLLTAVSVSFFTACSKDDKGGWRTYRHDGLRSAVTDENLPDNLSAKWVYRSAHQPKPAWYKPSEELPRMHDDNTYHIVSANGITYFGSSVDDKIYALNTENGKTEWTFFAEGPVRFAPTIWKDKLYFSSDDGHIYCLDADDGDLIWKYRASPSAKKLIGNGNMISLWPARTSVLVENGIVYATAGIFPYEGLYIFALDAKNGKVIWKNDTIGDKAHELQYGGISPHGYLLTSKDNLYIPSGRNMPAAFDKKTGKFLYALSAGSKAGGTWALIADSTLIAGTERSGTPAKIAYDLKSGRREGDAFVSFNGIDMVFKGNISYVVTETGIHAIERKIYPQLEKKINTLLKEIKDTNGELRKIAQGSLDKKKIQGNEFSRLIEKNKSLKRQIDSLKISATKWNYEHSGLNTIVLAGNKIIAGGKNIIVLIDADSGKELQQFKIDGRAMGLAVADGHLLANDEKGNIYCFGNGTQVSALNIVPQVNESPFAKDKESDFYKTAARRILKVSAKKKGYCLVLDNGQGRLALELAKNSDMKIVAIDDDEERIKESRLILDKTGLYGERIVVENWNLEDLPDYFADLIVSDGFLHNDKLTADAQQIYRILKPYGGTVCLGRPNIKNNTSQLFNDKAVTQWLNKVGAAEPQTIRDEGLWITTIRGPLKGAGSWTHLYANAANTICSDDQRANYPFGVLWFGEPGPEKMVERHARAAAPVAKNGKLFIQGENLIMAYDSYNGTKLWERDIPGANRVRVDVDGSNLALSDFGLFVAIDDHCLLLDAETGKTLHTYKIPLSKNGKMQRWGYVSCAGNTLFGSAAKPFKHEYSYITKVMEKVEKGDIKNADGLPAYFSTEYPSDEAAVCDFQRSGAKWRFIEDFPAWSGGIVTQEPSTDKIMYSNAVFAFDIPSGKSKWVYRGKRIAHITISIGDGNIIFADKAVSAAQQSQGVAERRKLSKEGIWEPYKHRVNKKDIDVRMVTVLDTETGKIKWQKPVDLIGCGGDAVASAYQDDVLLFFGSFGLHDKWRFTKNQLRWHRITALSAQDGKILWSRPLNYMVRPVIVGNTIIIEPRACDLHTGKIKTRIHPVTGKEVPWEYYRPGHTCAITSASPTTLFYRSYNAAIYDLANDRGITYFGAVRPGCWINMIPANGLLLFPEASSGCTCSFPLRTTLVLEPLTKREPGDWSVFVSHGPVTPVKRLAINLGAPGDKKDKNGNIWFAYPRPRTGYGVRFRLNETVADGMGYFAYDFRGVNIDGTDSPWLYTSGCAGFSKCRINLLDKAWEANPGVYTVRLGFYAPTGDHTFDIKLQNKNVLSGFNPTENSGAVVKEFKNIKVDNDLLIELVPHNSSLTVDNAPIINSIEIIREDIPQVKQIDAEKLTQNELKTLLKAADTHLKAGNEEDALRIYHQIYNESSSRSLQMKALTGLAKIGSTASLPVIADDMRQTDLVFWNYEPPSPEFIDALIRVYTSIAENFIKSRPQKAKVMLQYAGSRATDLTLEDRIVSDLMKVGDDSLIPSVNLNDLIPGIHFDYFTGSFTSVNALDNSHPSKSGTINGFNLEKAPGVNQYGYAFRGYLNVPKNGYYVFYVESNDGAKLYIDGKEIVDNDGAHGAKEESGSIALRKGFHPVQVKYFQMGGGQALKVSWQGPGFAKRVITDKDVFIKKRK
jgi:outer membrane protein assembly factor BamB